MSTDRDDEQASRLIRQKPPEKYSVENPHPSQHVVSRLTREQIEAAVVAFHEGEIRRRRHKHLALTIAGLIIVILIYLM